MSDEQKPESDLVHIGSVFGNLFPPEVLSAMEKAAAGTETKKAVAREKKPRAAKNALAKAAAEIVAQPDNTERAYMARELVQCTLPHRDPGDVPAWVRRNGKLAIVLQPGFDEKTMKSAGLPYGSIPRLLMLWIVTEAVRNKNNKSSNPRLIKLGDTLNEFLREIGLNPRTGGGKRSDAKRLKEQMLRLFQCRFSFKHSEGNQEKGSTSFLNMELAREAHFWWDFKSPDQTNLFDSQIILGEVFFEAITAHAVPVDFRALRALKQSSFALDVYIWATYRTFTMRKAGQKEIEISLDALQEQFGSEYSRPDNFKAAFVEALEKVKEVFPALDFAVGKSALILRDGKGRPAIAPTDKTAAQKKLEELRPFDLVNEKAREWFKREYPGWDTETAVTDFYTWREEKGEQSGNSNAHFRAFAKTWVQRNR